MALATVADVEVSLGLLPDSLSAASAAQVQQHIDTISGYVLDITGTAFASVTETVRMQADGSGELVMTRYEPVTAVTTLTDYRTGIEITATQWTYFDGIDTIIGLYPRQVVDVVLTHGFTTVPASIKGVVVSAAKRAFQNPKNLVARAVADVSEEYGARPDGALYLTDQEREILAGWEDTETSWVLSVRPDYPDPRDYNRGGLWPAGPWL